MMICAFREHAVFELIDLLFHPFARELLGFLDQQTDDLCVIDVGLPKLLRELVVAPDLLGDLAELRQTDSKALESIRPFLPVGDAAFVPVLFQQRENLVFLHASSNLGRTGFYFDAGCHVHTWRCNLGCECGT